LGERTEYHRDHARVRRIRGKADTHKCVSCGGRAEDWAHIHDTDRSVVENYQAMCTKCHIRYDGRLEAMAEQGRRAAAAQRGVPRSPEDKEKIGNYWRGRPKTDEQKRRLSESLRAYHQRKREANDGA
jgi:hypothetical protein